MMLWKGQKVQNSSDDIHEFVLCSSEKVKWFRTAVMTFMSLFCEALKRSNGSEQL